MRSHARYCIPVDKHAGQLPALVVVSDISRIGREAPSQGGGYLSRAFSIWAISSSRVGGVA